MKLTQMKFYGGARELVCRLGLAATFFELQEILISIPIEIVEKARANSGRAIREAIDASFAENVDWKKTTSGGIDWIKRIRYNQTYLARLGVEIQVSSRSDLLIRDIVHLRNSLQKAEIDVGVIVVPDNRFGAFLTDRTPTFKAAVDYIEVQFPEAKDIPLVILAVENDAVGKMAIAKKKTNRGEGSARKKPGDSGSSKVREDQPELSALDATSTTSETPPAPLPG
jgi:hypothetical protein